MSHSSVDEPSNDRMTPDENVALGLYIHVPFCRTRCDFCAFYLQRYHQGRADAYIEALGGEMELHARLGTVEGRRFQTVYWGGGTPTILDAEQLCRMLDAARSSFGFEDDVELTIEAHPDSISEQSLQRLASAGFNRLSVGLQSALESELLAVGRETVASGGRAVTLARNAGFSNINVDVMYGLPGQTRDSWCATLQEVIALQPTHVSCYALTVEEHTRLHHDIAGGDRSPCDGDLQDAMEQDAEERLSENGYQRYELSNFSRPGAACRHNLLYWTNGDYLGLGPSAQSYVGGVRFGNIASLETYISCLTDNRLPIGAREILSRERRLREAVVFGLRRTNGVEWRVVDELNRLLAENDPWHVSLERLRHGGFLEQHADCLRLTGAGQRFADSVAEALL